MSGKITCTACGKVWQSGDEFQNDSAKCGKEFCIQKTEMSSEDRLKLIGQVARKRQKRLNIRVETCKVVLPSRDPDRQQLCYDVPQVVITHMSMF